MSKREAFKQGTPLAACNWSATTLTTVSMLTLIGVALGFIAAGLAW